MLYYLPERFRRPISNFILVGRLKEGNFQHVITENSRRYPKTKIVLTVVLVVRVYR